MVIKNKGSRLQMNMFKFIVVWAFAFALVEPKPLLVPRLPWFGAQSWFGADEDTGHEVDQKSSFEQGQVHRSKSKT